MSKVKSKGEMNLDTLLSSMQPNLLDQSYVFCTLGQDAELASVPGMKPIATFMEAEGLTLVLEQAMADTHSLAYDSVFRCITLTVHSSLDAVGLTAAVATKLTEHDISANVIAAYYHDHIFVQAEKAEAAMLALKSFQA